MSFDYGEKQPNGQYQRHPVNTEGDYVAPIRNSYEHTCGTITTCGDAIAKTYAKNPRYYGSTFCAGCRDYFPISEFTWSVDGVTLGDLGGEAGKDLRGKSGYIR